MRQVEMPFNWAQVRAYVQGARFSIPPQISMNRSPDSFDCLMAIYSTEVMREIRGWLQEQPDTPYEKFGCFTIEQEDNKPIVTRCIGVRFVFGNSLDLNYFRLSCHSGHPVIVD